jgi:riboflavin biosynthesis pyrimidine reductase
MLDVARELTDLYGTAEPPCAGVLHIMHVARDRNGRLAALRIGATSTPKSASDFFVVNAARAHADAVLTSAENLRREPELSHALSGPWAEALARYRREVLHKREPLSCAILTRTGDLPDPHPVWNDGSKKLIFTSGAAAEALRTRFETRATIVSSEGLDAVGAARWLHEHGAATVSLEAGPRTVQSFYEQHAVNELWLTHWESVTPDAEFAGALPEDSIVFAGLTLLGSSRRSEGGHSFRFERWSRRA